MRASNLIAAVITSAAVLMVAVSFLFTNASSRNIQLLSIISSSGNPSNSCIRASAKPEPSRDSVPAEETGMVCKNQVPKLTLITPWGRSEEYMPLVAGSIQWDCVYQWIIAYDTHQLKISAPYHKNNSKVQEIFVNSANSTAGGAQRQVALKLVKGGMVYFLDDDNVMHPRFWQWFAVNASLGRVYTFDQLRGAEPTLLQGSKPMVNCIDTSQLLFDSALMQNITWIAEKYNADGYFINALVTAHLDKYVYVPEVLAFHNYAQHHKAGAAWTKIPVPDATVSKTNWLQQHCPGPSPFVNASHGARSLASWQAHKFRRVMIGHDSLN